MVTAINCDGREMLSAIVATHELERSLVPTLAALVPGVTAGLLKEVVVADAGSKDATAEIADFAGCRFMTSEKALGVRLMLAANTTRAPWLLFLRAGTVLEPGWVGVVGDFIEKAHRRGDAGDAAVFRRMARGSLGSGLSDLFALARATFMGPQPEQGLLIARRIYDQIGGHRDEAKTEAALLWRLGRQTVTLRAGAHISPDFA